MIEPDSPIIFAITEEDLQYEARRLIKRRLTEEEIHYAKKGIETGLMFDICTVYATAIEEAVEICQ